MIDDQINQKRQVQRKYLLDVIKCLRYLALQEIPLKGLDNNDILTQILYLLETKDDNTTKLQGKVGQKYTHHDIHNELLHIMASNLLRKFQLFVNGDSFQSWMMTERTFVCLFVCLIYLMPV